MYGHEEREAEQSINFVTCHDGFTLNDLVSYERKHNEANGEANRDGSDDNLSWNCGHEGPCDDPAVEALRNRQVKNFMAVTLLAFGTPMLLMGDEVRRTQRGNNNVYCQDNETGWFDWGLLEEHADIRRFVTQLISARLQRDVAVEDPGLTLNELIRQGRFEWHGVTLGDPDWGDSSHSIALTAQSLTGRITFHIMVNAWQEALSFQLPLTGGHSGGLWYRWLDTSLESPDDIVSMADAPLITGKNYELPSHSLAVLFSNDTTTVMTASSAGADLHR